MEIRCSNPACGVLVQTMGWNIETARRPEGKLAITVTCYACQHRMSLVVNIPEEESREVEQEEEGVFSGRKEHRVPRCALSG